MQFHLNGFRPGDPDVATSADGPSPAAAPLPEQVDVLIVGCGPAGLTLAAQLSVFPDIKTLIVEQKPGPLLLGQADGIACRTMEMFEAFGFSERLMKEAYWVNETAFWKPDEHDPEKIKRHGRVQDVEDGLSEFPHVILNQARVHDFYLNVMRNSPTRLEPHYSWRLSDLAIDTGNDANSHPVSVTLEREPPGTEPQRKTVKARYVVGCDGARSNVRKSLGRALHGDSANHAWGVMDVLAVTDFPDIRCKCLVQSTGQGNIVIIPREGGYLVRIYVEMEKLSETERVANRNISVEQLIAATQRILHPHKFEVKEVAWWSVYEIGQRLCDKFDDVPDARNATRLPHVFIAGDACHTHSPKAGQGMNVSMQDAFNLGWKLVSVIRRQAVPELLHTYSSERQFIAKELIEFDREWANLLTTQTSAAGSQGADPAEVQKYFVRSGHYTAGTATKYRPSAISADATHQHLATGFPIGMRLHSAPVIRLADAKPMQLGHTVKADGRWRLFAFCGRENPASPASPIRALCDFLLDAPGSPIRKCTPARGDIDSVIDVRAVFQQGFRELHLEEMPPLLLPQKGRYGLRDYEKIFCADQKDGRDIFDMRGINRDKGCMIVVRPDQYVANILPLNDYTGLSAFFDRFMLPRN